MNCVTESLSIAPQSARMITHRTCTSVVAPDPSTAPNVLGARHLIHINGRWWARRLDVQYGPFDSMGQARAALVGASVRIHRISVER